MILIKPTFSIRLTSLCKRAMITVLWLSSAFVVVPSTPGQNLKLPPLFGDNMVLQQTTASFSKARSTVLWGWSRSKEKLIVKAIGSGQPIEAKGSQFKKLSDGWYQWTTNLKKLEQGVYIVMITQQAEELVITNVLVGEVWVSGVKPLANVTIRSEAKSAVNESIYGRARVLFLQSFEFHPDDSTVAKWVGLSSVLNSNDLSTWNAHFANSLLRTPHETLESVGLVIVERSLMEGVKIDGYLPDHSSDIDKSLQAGNYAMKQCSTDYEVSVMEFNNLVSYAKRRGTSIDVPAPDEFAPSPRLRLHHDDLPTLNTTVRGAIW